MKPIIYVSLFVVLTLQEVSAQEKSIFPRGEKAPNAHHVGTVWLNELSPADSVFTYSISLATFDPAARLYWHQHPGGQILLITEGVGYYQEKGKTKQVVRKGDVVKCLPNVTHWHGATPESGVTYVATSPAQKGKTIWLEKVTDQEYNSK